MSILSFFKSELYKIQKEDLETKETPKIIEDKKDIVPPKEEKKPNKDTDLPGPWWI